MLKKICVNIEEIIAGIALCIMSVATVFNVFCRLILSKSYPWAEEISYFCFAWLIFVEPVQCTNGISTVPLISW